MALTPEQFKKLRGEGFTIEKIAEFEQKRQVPSAETTTMTPPDGPPSLGDQALDTYGRFGLGAYQALKWLPGVKQLANIVPGPTADEQVAGLPKGNIGQQVVTGTGAAIATIPFANPFLKVASVIPKIRQSAIASGAVGFGGFEGFKKGSEGKPEEILPATVHGAVSGAVFGAGGRIGAELMPKFIPGAERIGTTLGTAAAGALTAPEGEKVSGAIIGGSLGALNPVSRMKGPSEQQIDSKIMHDINKSVRPSVVGKNRQAWQLKKFNQDVPLAIKDIVLNKNKITLGEESGRVPKDLVEAQEAILQRKKAIWEERVTLAKGSDSVVNIAQIYRKALTPLMNSEAVKLNNPEFAVQMNKMIERAGEISEMPVSKAHNLLTDLNKGLEPYYKNPTLVPDSLKVAEANIARALREHIDAKIEQDLGSGYGNLGKRYGALRALEKEVLPRITVSGRASPKGFFDIADLWAVPRVLKGIATGNGVEVLEGMGTLGVKGYIKSMNNSNAIISRMFQYVDKHAGNIAPLKGVELKAKEPVLGLPFNPAQKPRYLQERETIPPIRNPIGEASVVPPDVALIPPTSRAGSVRYQANAPKESVIDVSEFNPIKKSKRGLASEKGSAYSGGKSEKLRQLNEELSSWKSRLTDNEFLNDKSARRNVDKNIMRLQNEIKDIEKGLPGGMNTVIGATGLTLAAGLREANAQTLGEKNNNPINIKAFDKWDGMIGKDKQGHAQFKSLEYGIRASIKNLKNHQRKHPTQSIKAYLKTFAEANSEEEANYISENMGISPNTSLARVDMDEFLIHLAKFESKMDLTKDQIVKIKNKFKL